MHTITQNTTQEWLNCVWISWTDACPWVLPASVYMPCRHIEGHSQSAPPTHLSFSLVCGPQSWCLTYTEETKPCCALTLEWELMTDQSMDTIKTQMVIRWVLLGLFTWICVRGYLKERKWLKHRCNVSPGLIPAQVTAHKAGIWAHIAFSQLNKMESVLSRVLQLV